MIQVIGIHESGWFEKGTERVVYEETCSAYGVTFKLAERDADVQVGDDLVVFDAKGTLLLDEFEHPETARYVFGRSGHDLRFVFPGAPCVRIQTPNLSHMFGVAAVAVVLDDRKRKMQ